MRSKKRDYVQKVTATSMARVPVPLEPPTAASSRKVLERAYICGITNGNFYDVVLYAYSCKTPSGIICKPRPVYANSSILESRSGYFRSLLSSSFVENKLTDIDAGFPADKPSFVRDYDYDCDSDLESISEDEFEEEKSCEVVEQPAEECKTSGESLADDSSQAKNTEPFTSNAVRLGHAILISGVAFSTLRSMITYMVLEEPTFLPLNSSGKPRISNNSLEKHFSGAILCSPKSAYRAADMFQLEWLQKSAAENIRSQLTEDNILHELFSSFTSSYDELIKMQIDYLFSLRRSQRIRETLPLWITKVSGGEIPSSNIILTRIMTLWLQY